MDPNTQLTFARPAFLGLLPLVVAVGMLMVWGERRRRKLGNRFQSERLRGVGLPARAAAPWLWSAGLLIASLALAGPRFGTVEVQTVRSTQSTMIVLDVSNSMLVEDVGASRLSVAKAIAGDLLSRTAGRTGLVVFEGTAEPLAPLTDDHAAVALMLESIGTGELERSGSSVELAIGNALEMFERGGAESGDIVLLSDGENRGNQVDRVLADARSANVRIHTVMIGTPEGGTIPGENGPMTDDNGTKIVSRARPQDLQRIAEETGGTFFANPLGEDAVRAVSGVLSEGQTQRDDATVSVAADRYQIPLALALALFVCGSFVRRGAE